MRTDYKIKTISLSLDNNAYIENIFYTYRLKDFTKTINIIFEIIRTNSDINEIIRKKIAETKF